MLFCISYNSLSHHFFFFFFFNDTATTEIYTLSLHDALPISTHISKNSPCACVGSVSKYESRSEEHTSELQSQSNLVCRLLLEKKKTTIKIKKVGFTTFYISMRLQLYLLM